MVGRAIVTFARGWHALAVTRSLGRRGIEVLCGEEARFAPARFSRYCRGSFCYPRPSSDPEGFIDRLEQYVREHRPQHDVPYVLMPIHKETLLVARYRNRLEPHIRFVLPEYETLLRLHDKARLAELAQELGLGTPPTWQIESREHLKHLAGRAEFPVMLKLRTASSGVGVCRIDDRTRLVENFDRLVKQFDLTPAEYPLLQQYVEGDDYCVSALFDRGVHKGSFTYSALLRFPRVTGVAVIRKTVSLPRAEDDVRRLLTHLKWHGVAQVDVRLGRDGTIYLLDGNPRFFGGLLQAIVSGLDYPWMLYRMALGEEVETVTEVNADDCSKAPILAFIASMLERVECRAHSGQMAKELEGCRRMLNDLVDDGDWRPILGVLFPLGILLRHRRVTWRLLTGEE